MKAKSFFCLALSFVSLFALGLETWPPSNLSADDHVYVVPVEVESVSESPVAITFRIHKTEYALDVYRKTLDAPDWGNKITTIAAGTDTWTHNATSGPDAIQVGTAYEYRFHAQGVPSAWDSTNVRTYVMAGIHVDRSGSRGRVVLVMPESIQAPLAFEIQRFKQDLAGDGWTVHDVLTPDGRTDFTCAADGHHVQIRNDIIAIYNAHPGEVKHVILLGRVPQPRSGLRAAWAPDGHGDLGAVAADMYYADVDNTWTDTGTISVAYGNNAGQVRPAWHNNPGDGRFDPSHFRHLSEAFEMGWGRIDFRGSVNGGDEIGALRNYLNKLHDYKHAQNGFVPGRRSVIRDAGSLYKHVQEEFWKVITPLSGMENLEYITGGDLPESAGQPEAQYTFDNGPYLYFFMAGNEPNQPSDNSRAVFWTGFKSHVGYHDLNGWTRSRLAEPNSWTLSWTFAPPRGRYVYHKMGLGGTMGDVMLATINNQNSSSGRYGSAVKNYINGAWTVQSQGAGGTGDYAGFTFHNHMGDPTLRDQMIQSPQWVRGRLQSGGAQVQVEWQASPDAAQGYDIYSAPSTLGPFTKRNGIPLHVNELSGELSWTDSSPSSDPIVYMVRALKMENTPSGSYLNASVGRMVEVDRSPAAFAVATSSLPTAYLGSVYSFPLQTTGGNPPAVWTLTSGSLPTGLSFSPSGLVSGTPTNAGSFPLTFQATDLLGAVQSTTLTFDVEIFDDWALLPNGDMAAAPTNTGSVAQWVNPLNNWQHPAAPNTQWDYDAENEWAVTYRDGRAGAQPGMVYVLNDGQTQVGAVAFRYDLINTDGSGKPNTMYVRIYGINGNFSWDHWNLGSNPSGDATLLHIAEITGSFDWTTFETPALPVGDGYEYYVLRFYPSDVTNAEGDFMAIDNLLWSTAAPPPVFYDVTFAAGANGSLTGDLAQNVVGGGSTAPVTAVPASGYELAQWTWTGGGSSTDNPLVISGVSADLTVTATFQLFNHPPVSTISSPADGASFPMNAVISFSGTGSDVEDGEISAAVWSSSIDGVFTPEGGTYAGLSTGEHVITRTVTDSGGKTGSASVTISILEPLVRVAEADAMVRGDGTNADTNFGAATPIRTRVSESAEGLYRFDVSDVPGHLVSATLRLVLSNADGGTINVHELLDDSWGELTVTYNTRPAPYGAIIGQIQAPVAASGTAMELDVTAYIATRLASGVASFATTGTGSLVRVHSREASNADFHPRLILVYSLDEPPPANTAPTVAITAPANNTTVTQGASVTFTGTATDTEDGDLTAQATWTSSLDGAIGNGGSVTTSSLSTGEHTITFSVTDSGGMSSSELIILTVNADAGGAELWMPSIFQNSMVLQRGQPIAIFGKATAGESITVTFNGQSKTTAADGTGKWLVYLDAETASATGRTLTVQGNTTLTYTNVLVGEVWLLSGQSNMARSLAQSNTTTNADNDRLDFEAAVNAGSLTNIRMFRQTLVESETPADDVDGGVWSEVSSSNLNATRNFSALGLYYAQKLYEDTGVPVGLVAAAWGGRQINRFISAEYSQNDRHVQQQASTTGSRIYNKMIFPLAPYTMKGSLWYQGESDVSFAWIYYKQLTTLIANWRDLWGQEEFHFGIVQLANWQADSSDQNALEQQWDLRQAQDYVDQAVEDTFLASFVDAELFSGDLIHPPAKKVLGDRLALRAQEEVYGLGSRPSHPRFAGHTISGNQVTVHYDTVGGGLTTTDGQAPSGFHVAGSDRVWVAADAAIVGDTIVVSAPGVSNPVAVTYHTRVGNGMNLYTTEGWPVLPFATDQWAPNTGWTPTRQESATRALLFYYPVDTQVFASGESILLAADATINFNNTNLEMQKVEFFNGETKIGEAMGSPALFNWTGVPAGTYTITAKSKSSDNVEVSSETVTITVQSSGATNDAPVVVITSPSDSASFGNADNITFTGTATDTEDGNIASSATWSSSVDGSLGTGGSFSTSSLTDDRVHTITFSATDSGSLTSADSITITVGTPVANSAPTASITAPTTGATYTQGDNVSFTGTGTDAEDGNVSSSAVWSSSLDGQIGTGATFATTALTVGTHTITLTVTDSGSLQGTNTISVTVNAGGGGGSYFFETDFTGTALSQNLPWTNTSSIASGLSNSGWSRGAGLVSDTYYGATAIDNALGFIVVASGTRTLLVDAVTADVYLSNTLSGTDMNLNGATVTFAGTMRTRSSNPNDWAVMTSVGGFTPGSEVYTAVLDRTQNFDGVSQEFSFTLPANGYDNLGSIEIRIYPYDARWNGNFDVPSLDTFRITGATVSTGPGGEDAYTAWATVNGIVGGGTDLMDGVPNLLRYAMGGTAESPAENFRLQGNGDSEALSIQFNRIADPALVYEVWATDDLTAGWGMAPVWTSSGAENTEGGVTVPVDLDGRSALMLYLQIRRP